jgi:type I restriction enzyme M protein
MNDNKELYKTLRQAVDLLKGPLNPVEYKYIILSLLFIRFLSEAFEEVHSRLKSGTGEYTGADPEDKKKYRAAGVFYIPGIARWNYLQSR